MRFEEKQGFCRYRKLIIFGTALWVHEREICSRDFAEECLAFKFVLLEVSSEHGPVLEFGLGCSCDRMLLEHERYHGLGMDALRPVCSWNTNAIMVWAWML